MHQKSILCYILSINHCCYNYYFFLCYAEFLIYYFFFNNGKRCKFVLHDKVESVIFYDSRTNLFIYPIRPDVLLGHARR